MMSEMDPPPTSRLRRRSFFENSESEPSTADSVALNETDLASAASASSSTSSALGDGGEGLALDPHGFSPPPSGKAGKVSPVWGGDAPPSSANEDRPDPSSVHSGGSTTRFRRAARFFVELSRRAAAWMALRLQFLWLAWSARFPAASARLTALWQRAARLWPRGPAASWLTPWRRDPAGPTKYWVYPTQWLTYASVSLVALQLLIYWQFQTLPLDLRVHECVFRERLLATADLLATAGPQPAAAALRFLERRFEQQYGPGVRQSPGKARLPWSCVAVIPVGGEAAQAQADELAFLWPRSQVVVSPATVAQPLRFASRVHVAVGGSALVRADGADGDTGTGVFAALFPLSSFRTALFPTRFPDLVLVKTEFALRQMLKYRQERQEERDHRGVQIRADHADPAATQFGVYLLRTTVPDLYDRHVRKRWDEFLHIVAVGDADKKEQFTEELLAAWVTHPTWPMLHVRFQRSLALCGAFQRVLSTMLADFEADAAADTAAAAADADPDRAAEDWLDGLDREDGRNAKPAKRTLNVDLVCEEAANSGPELARLKNAIGMHLFPVPPELERGEERVLESAAVGAVIVTYNTPIMQEWVPDSIGLRVGTFDLGGPADEAADPVDVSTAGLVTLPTVHVTPSEIEHAVEQLLVLDRVNRVAAGRAARVHYLRLRTHYLSAVAALDAAVCDGDDDEPGETQSEIGQHSRRKIEVETLRAFLY